jgi:hypothetical protein
MVAKAFNNPEMGSDFHESWGFEREGTEGKLVLATAVYSAIQSLTFVLGISQLIGWDHYCVEWREESAVQMLMLLQDD